MVIIELPEKFNDPISGAYLRRCQTSATGIFCKNNQQVLAVKSLF